MNDKKVILYKYKIGLKLWLGISMVASLLMLGVLTKAVYADTLDVAILIRVFNGYLLSLLIAVIGVVVILLKYCYDVKLL